MTPRERWIALLERRTPDRIPTDYWATSEVTERLKRDLGCPDEEALYRKLHIDKPRSFGPVWTVTHHPDDPEADIWGCRYRRVDYGTGVYDEIAYHPLAAAQSPADIHAFRWPSPDDLDYSGIAPALDADDGFRACQAGAYEPFLLYAYLRGMEQAFEDLLVNPEIADAILGHMFDFYFEMNRRTFEAGNGRIDLFYLAEDLGSQSGPMFSLETYRRFFMPNQKRMAELARANDVHVFYHTDGSARIYLPDLVDVVGIEVLNPVQYRCKDMEREGLVRDFGSKIGFHGAIDNQQVLPFGTPDDVAREVRENVAAFSGSRWICAPCHNLQPVTPTENILALYEALRSI